MASADMTAAPCSVSTACAQIAPGHGQAGLAVAHDVGGLAHGVPRRQQAIVVGQGAQGPLPLVACILLVICANLWAGYGGDAAAEIEPRM